MKKKYDVNSCVVAVSVAIMVIIGNTYSDHFSNATSGDNNLPIILPAGLSPTIDGINLEDADEIGLFTATGICAGALVWKTSGDAHSIISWSDNSMTNDVIEGFVNGDTIYYKLWDNSAHREFVATAIYSNTGTVFKSSGTFLLLSSLEVVTVPEITSFLTDNATEGILFSYTASAIDPDGTIPIITFKNLPSWLTNKGNIVTGTPLNGTLTTTFIVIATDFSDNSLFDTVTITVTVAPVNDAPIVNSIIPDTSILINELFSYIIPSNTFTDIDDNTLSLTVSNLPEGLTFESLTNTISGTPTMLITKAVVVTAADKNLAHVSDIFQITVDAKTAILETDTTWEMGIASLTITPNPVSRNADGVNLIIPSEYSGRWNIAVYDVSGNLMDGASFNVANKSTYTWDLHSNYGQRVAAGSYVLIGKFTTASGKSRLFKKIVGVKK